MILNNVNFFLQFIFNYENINSKKIFNILCIDKQYFEYIYIIIKILIIFKIKIIYVKRN